MLQELTLSAGVGRPLARALMPCGDRRGEGAGSGPWAVGGRVVRVLCERVPRVWEPLLARVRLRVSASACIAHALRAHIPSRSAALALQLWPLLLPGHLLPAWRLPLLLQMLLPLFRLWR